MENVNVEQVHAETLSEAKRWMAEAGAAAKCWPCGCLHSTLSSLEAAAQDLPDELQPLKADLALCRAKVRPVEYECLGCATCYPALAANAVATAFPDRAAAKAACPTDIPEERMGWPPLPGDYRVFRYQAPVAICTLTDERLTDRLAEARPAGVAIIGRLPGQSLLSLMRNGLDHRGRIIEAKGKRPVIRNLPREAVEVFRKQVEVLDLIGRDLPTEILAAAAACSARDPGPAETFAGLPAISRTVAHPPDRLVLDPAGYFVIFPDARRRLLIVEHYQNDGVLDHAIEGQTPTDLYATVIDLGLLSRLDHAAYLGQEMARAHHALLTGHPFVQDAAPDEGRPPELEETPPAGDT